MMSSMPSRTVHCRSIATSQYNEVRKVKGCLKVTLQTCAPNNSTHADWRPSEGLACAEPVLRTPIGVSGNFHLLKAL